MFVGARCEPGCVCSAEMWLFDFAISSWSLISSSPNSPSSTQYPPLPYPQIPTSPTVTHPLHRYKQTMIARPPATGEQLPDTYVQAYLFGGEGYNPSAYYNDLWKWEYIHGTVANTQTTATITTQAAKSQAANTNLALWAVVALAAVFTIAVGLFAMKTGLFKSKEAKIV